MNLRKQQQPVIILVVAVVLLFVFLVRISLNLQTSRTRFRIDVGAEVDLEGAIDNMQKETPTDDCTELDRGVRAWRAATANQEITGSRDKRKRGRLANASLEDLRREKKSPSSVSM
jgi:hypothetical protein